MLHTILTWLRSVLGTLNSRDCPPDPLATLSLQQWADLPPQHPPTERCGS